MSGERQIAEERLSSQRRRLEFGVAATPSRERVEDRAAAQLVTRFQAGDQDAFADLYRTYFERIYGYLRVIFKNAHEAEEAAQQVFLKALEALPCFELRPGRPVRSWLFTIARNYALNVIRDGEREELVEPGEMDRRRETGDDAGPALDALGWISDRDLAFLVERLPLAQRQALLLRFQFDLGAAEIGRIMGRTPDDVRMLQSRAAAFLRQRLTALGRAPRSRPGDGPRERRMLRRIPEATVLRARRFSLRK